MNAVNAVLLFILVWTLTAVCQDDDDGCGVRCNDVKGTVGNKVNLNCRVSSKCTECCIKKYKFLYPNGSEICTVPLVNSCNNSNSFTWPFIPTTVMNDNLSFFVQASCGQETKKFTIVVTEPSLLTSEGSENKGSHDSVISSVVGCSVIVILIIILMIIICKKRPFEFQKRMFICIKHNDDNSNCPDNVI
ncbi:hypothetical protein Q8A67_020172 [Cirrhinus molitorella]|uniref:Uncharacterized protein n=1 Tax=Cirrhinus molitorella TaxID=172907 RepID=A0AA88PCY6_9TELE|nr:hypothetical protein Q8A67_020172 [Cirrhinus molitorella]